MTFSVNNRNPYAVPTWRQTWEALCLGSAVRMQRERNSRPHAEALGRMLRQGADDLRDGKLYFGTSDLTDAVDAMTTDAPTLPPAKPGRPRMILLDKPILASELDGAEDFSEDQRYSDGRINAAAFVAFAHVSKPGRAFDDPWFASDFYMGLMLEGGDARCVMMAWENNVHALARLVFWVADNPDLVTVSTTDVAKPTSRKALKRGKAHIPSPVTVIDLRAPHKKAAADVAQAERTYRHRWIVRGHWHKYRVGPGRTEEKVNYVMPYVKGPAGAPLNVTERVFKW